MKAKLLPLTAPLAYVVLGLILLMKPTTAASFLFTVIGILLVLYGAVTVITFFLRGGSGFSSQAELVFGVVAAVIGALLLAPPTVLLDFIFIILGVYVLADGLVNLKRGLDLREKGYAGWTATLATSAVSVLLGACILWRLGKVAEEVLLRVIGAAFLYEGVVDLIAIRTLEKLSRPE